MTQPNKTIAEILDLVDLIHYVALHGDTDLLGIPSDHWLILEIAAEDDTRRHIRATYDDVANKMARVKINTKVSTSTIEYTVAWANAYESARSREINATALRAALAECRATFVKAGELEVFTLACRYGELRARLHRSAFHLRHLVNQLIDLIEETS